MCCHPEKNYRTGDWRVPGLIKSVGQHQRRQKLDITDRDLN